MARGSLLAKSAQKQELRNAKDEKIKQKKATKFFADIYDALLNLDDKAACSFIKQPHLIKTCHANKSVYVLHAILIPLLANEHNWNEILNEMENTEIHELQNCVAQAKKESLKLDKSTIKAHLITKVLGYPNGTNLTSVQIAEDIKRLPRQFVMSAKTMFIIMEVADSQDEIIAEMDKLSYAIDNFERAPKQEKTIIDFGEEEEKEPKQDVKADATCVLWSTKQLCEKLGFESIQNFYQKKWQILNKKHPERKDEILSWFSKDGKMFDSKYFDELQQLLSEKRKTKRAKTNNNANTSGMWTTEETAAKLGMSSRAFSKKKWRILHKRPELREEIKIWFFNNGKIFDPKYFDELQKLFDEESRHNVKKQNSVEVEKPVEKVAEMESKKTSLVDLKAFEAYIEGLQKLIDSRTEKLKECDQIMAQAASEKDLQKRSELLDKLSAETKALAESQKDFEFLDDMLKRGQQLKAELTAFMEAAKQHIRK